MADYNPFARIDNLDDEDSVGRSSPSAPGTPPGPPPRPDRAPRAAPNPLAEAALAQGALFPPPRSTSSPKRKSSSNVGRKKPPVPKSRPNASSTASAASSTSVPKANESSMASHTSAATDATITDDDDEEGEEGSFVAGLGAALPKQGNSASAQENLKGPFWEAHFAWIDSVLDNLIHVTVKDPVQAARSFMNPNPPIKYLVVTEPLGYAVRRRYSDFLWLRDTLAKRFVGSAFPFARKEARKQRERVHQAAHEGLGTLHGEAHRKCVPQNRCRHKVLS